MAMTETAPAPDARAATLVREETAHHVRRLVLANPQGRNLLTEDMMAALKGALDRAGTDEDVRVVVIAGEGPAFSAGHDLKAMTAHRTDPDGGRGYFQKLFAQCSDLMEGIAANPRPVIAEVGAVAAAAGCQLVAACDLAVASEHARFGTTGVTFGLFCSTPMVPLTRSVGKKAALEMLFTGELIDAARAREIGLVNHVVPHERLTQDTMALAGRIATKSPLVLAMGKRAYHAQAGMGLTEAYGHCSNVMVENLMTADGEEGLAAFIEKRPPEWTGR